LLGKTKPKKKLVTLDGGFVIFETLASFEQRDDKKLNAKLEKSKVSFSLNGHMTFYLLLVLGRCCC
jgi:hypothetical protein